MLEVALHNPRQHQQFQRVAGPILLARTDEPEPLWLAIGPDRSATAQTLVEIEVEADAVRLKLRGCGQEFCCDCPCDCVGDCRIPLPAQFSIGDTRFEVTRGDARERASQRPLETMAGDRMSGGAIGRSHATWQQSLTGMAVQQSDEVFDERREVTLLFADLREFSPLAHSLGTQQTYDLLGDVMEALTAAVLDHEGLIVDYFGDGLAAMWNAPASHPEHPELACRAGLQMLASLPAIRDRWSETLVDELRLGIGIHTGVAQVGNAGSRRRIKYGPRGATVHLASRVEAATKPLGVSLAVTRATAARLSSRLSVYRLCRVQLPGISESIELFGVLPALVEPRVLAEVKDYERALALFERGELDAAAHWVSKFAPTAGATPAQFLARQIDERRGKHHRRRSDDQPISVGPVITIDVK